MSEDVKLLTKKQASEELKLWADELEAKRNEYRELWLASKHRFQCRSSDALRCFYEQRVFLEEMREFDFYLQGLTRPLTIDESAQVARMTKTAEGMIDLWPTFVSK